MIVAGEHYTLSGLARTEYNGLKVVATKFKDGRWVVEMLSARPDGRSQTAIRVKEVNLIATAATGGGGGGTAAQSALSSPATTLSASAAQHGLGLASPLTLPPVQLQLSAADARLCLSQS